MTQGRIVFSFVAASVGVEITVDRTQIVAVYRNHDGSARLLLNGGHDINLVDSYESVADLVYDTPTPVFYETGDFEGGIEGGF